MKIRRIIPVLTLFLVISTGSFSQILDPAKWEFSVKNIKKTDAGWDATLVFTATIDKDWYLYSSDFEPDIGPMVTTFSFNENATYKRNGEIQPVNPEKKFDEIFEMEVTFFKKKGVFLQKVNLLSDNPQISGTIEYQVCSDITGQCIPKENDFSFTGEFNDLPEGEKKGEKKETAQANNSEPLPLADNNTDTAESTSDTLAINETEMVEDVAEPAADLTKEPEEGTIADEETNNNENDLLAFLLAAFGFGLVSILTPCVFPLIPMTVAFFTNKGTGGKGQAILYGLSIIIIYTFFGTVFSLIFGAEGANALSTHWLTNIIFFAVFVIFALSFFGLFEITLPSGLVNSIDRKADKGGIIGVFFMALTLVVVSFSCTGPIFSSFILASLGGEVVRPMLGSAVFGLSFALPFTLFAIFPGWLKNLPKSGGWLQTVKVVLGFLELALAFKFLSVADQVYHWGLLDREVYLAIWIVIFSFLGLYLLKRFRLHGDAPNNEVSVGRLLSAIVVFSFVVYLIPGLVGAPLKALAGYLPPMYTHDFNLVKLIRESGGTAEGTLLAANTSQEEICEPPKYTDIGEIPHGIPGYFDYEQALECARKLNKPLFLDFTGHGCVNCREMEASVWSEPQVRQKLIEDYVVVSLYVDEPRELPEKEWYVSDFDGKLKKTIGKQNMDFQITRFQSNAQPYYVLLDPYGKKLAKPIGYERDAEKFAEYLEKGIKNFQSGKAVSVP